MKDLIGKINKSEQLNNVYFIFSWGYYYFSAGYLFWKKINKILPNEFKPLSV